jgi:flagella basal body P-ring formation protein FlgA
MSKDDIQIEFDPHDEPTLELTSPRFTFQFDTSRAGGLGAIAWDVLIKNDQGQRRATVSAKLRAWEEQLVLTRPLSRGQAILKNDVVTRRVLVDKLTLDKLASREQAIGEVASRDLKRDEVLTAGVIAAPPAVQAGDFVTVALTIGQTEVQTVARALDAAPRGGTIRARNEANGQVYQVRVTGPGTGAVTGMGQRIDHESNDVASTN